MTRYGELGQPWVFVVRLEKRKSQDTRKEHKSIPAFKIAQTPRAHTARGFDHGIESASLIRYFASHVPGRSI